MKIENYLKETDPKHSDFVDSFAYLIAAQEAKLRDDYILLYVKKKPWYLPKSLYEWILRKVLVLANFKI